MENVATVYEDAVASIRAIVKIDMQKELSREQQIRGRGQMTYCSRPEPNSLHPVTLNFFLSILVLLGAGRLMVLQVRLCWK